MSNKEIILSFIEQLTHSRPTPASDGRMQLIVDDYWIEMYDHLGRVYIDMALENAGAALKLENLNKIGFGLRIIKRQQEYWLQGSVNLKKSSSAFHSLEHALSNMVQLCEQLSLSGSSEVQTAMTGHSFVIPKGVFRP